MNCQNGICTPAYGTVHTPVATPTAAPRNVPFIANNGSAPYFGSGASVPQFNRNSYSTPISGSTLTSGQGNLGNRPFIPANMSGIAQLPVWEQQAALNQRT
ncbi:MAG: hypothetical protein KDA36_11790, partial [Planctomycetaceae bacterium]|nr:hypothetical protein [Planctomycetaceae bacterium]